MTHHQHGHAADDGHLRDTCMPRSFPCVSRHLIFTVCPDGRRHHDGCPSPRRAANSAGPLTVTFSHNKARSKNTFLEQSREVPSTLYF